MREAEHDGTIRLADGEPAFEPHAAGETSGYATMAGSKRMTT